MKRLTYISRASKGLSAEEIQHINDISIRNNRIHRITGVLLYLRGLFFQILEGDEQEIDQLYTKILADERHIDILCLRSEHAVLERQFPDWAMKVINLDEHSDLLLEPIKTLLQTVTESHRILEKYTQPTIIKLLTQGINPLTIQPLLTEKIIFFSDICAFSTLSEKLPVHQIVELLNFYFTLCAQTITHYGGEVTKFIGDCVMAAFPPSHADNAIHASLEILNTLQTLRNNAQPQELTKILYVGIGLSCGQVIEGNLGSNIKMDYTLIGDSVNVAARLESLTRDFPYSLIFTREIKNHCRQLDWNFVDLGHHQAKGKAQSIEIHSIEAPMVTKPATREQLTAEILHHLNLRTSTS